MAIYLFKIMIQFDMRLSTKPVMGQNVGGAPPPPHFNRQIASMTTVMIMYDMYTLGCMAGYPKTSGI